MCTMFSKQIEDPFQAIKRLVGSVRHYNELQGASPANFIAVLFSRLFLVFSVSYKSNSETLYPWINFL